MLRENGVGEEGMGGESHDTLVAFAPRKNMGERDVCCVKMSGSRLGLGTRVTEQVQRDCAPSGKADLKADGSRAASNCQGAGREVTRRRDTRHGEAAKGRCGWSGEFSESSQEEYDGERESCYYLERR